MANWFKFKSSTAALALGVAFFLGSASLADQPELVVQAGHRGQVNECFWLNNKELVTVGDDGALKLWNARNSRVKRTIRRDENERYSIVDGEMHPEGLWAAQSNGVLRLWDVKQGVQLKSIKLPKELQSHHLRFTRDSTGRTYLHAGRSEFFVLGSDGKFQKYPWRRSIVALTVSNSGNLVAIADSQGASVGPLGQPKTLEQSFATRWGIDDLAFSGDERTLFVGASANWLETWDLKELSSPQRSHLIPLGKGAVPEADLRSPGYSGEDLGLSLESLGSSKATILLKTGKTLVYDSKNKAISAVCDFETWGCENPQFSPDGKSLVATNETRKNPIALYSESQGWATESMGGRADSMSSLKVQGDTLYSSSNHPSIQSFDLRSGQPGRSYPSGYFPEMATGPTLLVCGGNDGVLRAYATESGQRTWERKLLGNGKGRFSRGIKKLALSKDESLLATSLAYTRNEVIIQRAHTGATVANLTDVGSASDLLFSSDGRQLFIASGSAVKLYDLSYKKVLHEWKMPGRDIVVELVEHPSNSSKLLALLKDGNLVEMDRQNLDQEPTLRQRRRYRSNAIATLGSKLLIAQGDELLLSNSQGSQELVAGKHQDSVADIAVYGDVILTSGWDSQTHVWQKGTLRKLATLTYFDDGKEWLVTTPSLNFDGSDGAEKLIEWRWKGKLYEVSQFYERFHRPGVLAQVLRGQSAETPTELGSQPPAVSISPPKALGKSMYEVAINVEGQHAGWEDVRLYHNGHRVAGKSPFRFKALSGENHLRASAFNKEKTIESAPDELRFQNDAPKEASTLHVFCVAVNDYPNPLDFAVDDAKSFSGAFEPGLFDKVNKVTLLNKEATKSNIVEKLSKLNCQPNDTLLVFLAGHGTMIDQSFHYLPHGTDGSSSKQALSSKELGQLLSQLPATRQVLFLDTCHAGASARDLANILVEKNTPLTASSQGSSFIRDQKVMARQAGTFLVAGSSPEAKAAEIPQLGHGLFTYAVLDGLNSKTGGSDLTVNELLNHLNRNVPRLSQKFRGRSQGIWQFSAGQDFPIAKPK